MGRPHTYAGKWADMVKAVGGVDQLAKAIGCNVATLRRWAKGRREPTGKWITRINETEELCETDSEAEWIEELNRGYAQDRI